MKPGELAVLKTPDKGVFVRFSILAHPVTGKAILKKGYVHYVKDKGYARCISKRDPKGNFIGAPEFCCKEKPGDPRYAALIVQYTNINPASGKFLKGELDQYLPSRAGEVVEELPLNRVENQPYIHYQKGSLAMYWLKEIVGADVVNRALQKLLAEFAFKPAPYPSSTDFLRLLRAEAGPTHDQLITDLFEKITLYDMKARDASAKKLPDGKYEVSFTVEGKKLHADGKGKETEAPLDEPFDLGVFTEEPGKKGYKRESVLLMERRPIKSGKQVVTLIVNAKPRFAGVDPYNKRIDRNSDDNFTAVVVE